MECNACSAAHHSECWTELNACAGCGKKNNNLELITLERPDPAFDTFAACCETIFAIPITLGEVLLFCIGGIIEGIMLCGEAAICSVLFCGEIIFDICGLLFGLLFDVLIGIGPILVAVFLLLMFLKVI